MVLTEIWDGIQVTTSACDVLVPPWDTVFLSAVSEGTGPFLCLSCWAEWEDTILFYFLMIPAQNPRCEFRSHQFLCKGADLWSTISVGWWHWFGKLSTSWLSSRRSLHNEVCSLPCQLHLIPRSWKPWRSAGILLFNLSMSEQVSKRVLDKRKQKSCHPFFKSASHASVDHKADGCPSKFLCIQEERINADFQEIRFL